MKLRTGTSYTSSSTYRYLRHADAVAGAIVNPFGAKNLEFSRFFGFFCLVKSIEYDYNLLRDQEMILSLVPIPFSRETAPLAVSFIFS